MTLLGPLPPLSSRLFQQRLRSALLLGSVGCVLGMMVGMSLSVLDGLWFVRGVLLGGLIGLMIGTGLGVSEEFALPVVAKKLSFWQLMALREIVYGTLAVATLAFANVLDGVVNGFSAREAIALLWQGSGLRDLVIAIVIGVLLGAAFQLRRLLPPRYLWHLISGRYHYPQEEERVFLFADLVNSTSIAERIGHVRYSHLLRDLFADLSDPVLAWQGMVYQYVGDGVIVTWPAKSGVQQGAVVHCFFDMEYALADRRAYYEKTYGQLPRLRAAAHVGPVVTAWVGATKLELAFHGDTLNTTARLQGLARNFESDLVISEELRNRVCPLYDIEVEPRGEVFLRGRAQPMGAFTAKALAPTGIAIV